MSPTLLLALLAAVDAGPVATAADAPTVTARTERNEGHVGDKIPLRLTSVGPRAMPVVLPANLDLGKFTELERSLEETDLGDGKMRRQFTLGIAAYEPGSFEIPPVELTCA